MKPLPTEDLGARTFVLGTRKSKLALWQANFVGALLQKAFPTFRFRLETFVTSGDRKLDQPLPEIGGKGLFTLELENALRSGAIDFVVHSLKDLPVEESEGLRIAAIPPRENPRDVLIAAQPWTVDTLPQGARVGTSSLRRSAQLLHRRPDLRLLPLRGNVDTRVRKALEGEYDAVVLAAAGVRRLGLEAHVSQEIPLEVMLPAPGQGALAVQCRAEDRLLGQILEAIDHPPTRLAVTAERAFLKGVGGGCSAPIAAYAEAQGNGLHLTGLVADPEGHQMVRVSEREEFYFSQGGESSLPDEDFARQLGTCLAQRALAQGADRLLKGLAAG